MDLVGTMMGLVTIPMALLSVASLLGGVGLLAMGAWQPVLVGLAAFGACLLFAPILEQVVVAIDTMTVRTLERGGRSRAQVVAVASGAVPVLVVLSWEFICFRWFVAPRDGVPFGLLWLWSYGVATGPWTLFALRVSRFRRTLCAIRAYAGHIAYWLLSLCIFGLGLDSGSAAAVMILPAILPFTVGMLLALADRDTLTNVRI